MGPGCLFVKQLRDGQFNVFLGASELFRTILEHYLPLPALQKGKSIFLFFSGRKTQKSNTIERRLVNFEGSLNATNLLRKI